MNLNSDSTYFTTVQNVKKFQAKLLIQLKIDVEEYIFYPGHNYLNI